MIATGMSTVIGVGLVMGFILRWYPKYTYEGRHRAVHTVSSLHIPVQPSGAKRRWDGKSWRRDIVVMDRPNKHSVKYLGAR